MEKIMFNGVNKTYNSWNELFNETKTVDIDVVNTGKIRVKKSNMINLKSDKALEMADEVIWVSVRSVVVNHPEKGIYLLDTGLDSSFQRSETGKIKGILKKKFVKGHQDKGQSIGEYLGENKNKIKGIFYTHLHYDHISGTLDLPKIDLYISGENEKADNLPLLFSNNYLSKVETIEQLNFKKDSAIAPFEGSIDLLGDKSIWAIPTPGHTKGGLSYLMKTNEGIVLFVGDACIEMGIDNNIGPGTYSTDIGIAEDTMFKIKEFIKKYPKVRIIYTHSIIKS